MGRWDLSGANPTTGVGALAEWPGSGAITTFTGPDITIKLTDTCNSSGTDGVGPPVVTECDTVTIEIDGLVVPQAGQNVSVDSVPTTPSEDAPITLAGGGAETTILVSGLAAGVSHTVGVYKNTDTYYGGSYVFGGFFPANAPGDAIQTETYSFNHHIEWIGDDQTAGTGDLGANAMDAMTCNTDATNSSEFWSAARVVSEYFDAEHHNISLSGIGVYESDGYSQVMSTLYPQVLPSEMASTWNFASFVPDLVVVNLGSYGDFTQVAADPGATYPSYQDALQEFIGQVRAAHPSAFILLVSGPSYPGPEQPSEANGWVANALAAYQTANPTDRAVAAYDAATATEFSCEQYEVSAGSQGTPTSAFAGGLVTFIEDQAGLSWTAGTWNQGQ